MRDADRTPRRPGGARARRTAQVALRPRVRLGRRQDQHGDAPRRWRRRVRRRRRRCTSTLDIFGFENWRQLFEQLCINFANEKLHQLFLYAMFKAEHEVIALEKVSLPFVDYADNERCLQMLERAPSGVFHLLDTCCRVNSSPSNSAAGARRARRVRVPQAGDQRLQRGPRLHRPPLAGDVEYAADDFLKKNAETMEVMTRRSSPPALAFLQATYDDAEETRRAGGGGRPPPLVVRGRQQRRAAPLGLAPGGLGPGRRGGRAWAAWRRRRVGASSPTWVS